MPKLYRLTKAIYAKTAFRGSRGRGRWHRRGTPVVCAADSPATALLETLVHTQRSDLITEPFVVFEIDLSDEYIVSLAEDELPATWRVWPWAPEPQAIGTLWYDQALSACLSVPSAVISSQRNYLLNTHHPDYVQARVLGPTAFDIDMRLGARG